MIETILFSPSVGGKDDYKKLKWLDQFKSTDLSRPSLNCIYILGGSLVAADGFSLGRIDIPPTLKEYCKGKKAFNIIKMAASPNLAVLEEVKVGEGNLVSMEKQLLELIDKSKEVSKEEQRVTSMGMRFLKRITTMPSNNGNVRFFVKTTNREIVVVSTDGYALLMPVHMSGDKEALIITEPIQLTGKIKLSEEGKALAESAGIKVKKEY